ncbi:MAG: tetratricopeptide repeat protein [Candidatus Thorarchaeota archaeon]|nr:tetratricopeptide repeat protein [Candidatus Thorarchaeota archaeon]
MTSSDETLRSIEAHLKDNPDDAEAWNAKGVVLAQMESYGEALRSLDRAIRLDPHLAPAHLNRGIVLLSLGPHKAKDALHAFNKALEITPGNVRVLQFKAATLKTLGRPVEELECLQEIAKSVDDDEHLYLRMGDALVELGRAKESISDYDHSLEIKPDFVPALVRRAIALSLLERWNDALASAKRATELAPDDPETWRVLGEINLRAERYRPAAKALKRAAKLKPEDASIENALGTVAYKSGDLKEAVIHFRRAVDLNSRYKLALMNLALSFMGLKEYDKARKTWMRLVKLEKNWPEVWDAYATTCVEIGRFCEAYDAWEHAIRLFKQKGRKDEVERIAPIARAVRISCGKIKRADRKRREKEKMTRTFSDRFELRRKKQKKKK